LIVPKSMFDIFGTLPVEIQNDQLSQKSAKNDDDESHAIVPTI